MQIFLDLKFFSSFPTILQLKCIYVSVAYKALSGLAPA